MTATAAGPSAAAAAAAETIAAHSDVTNGLDAENPWPGLESFRESDAAFFRGREAEADALLRLVRRERLTILYSLSGLGKSSLLRAGLFPRLGEELCLPVYIRLAYDAEAAPFREQILAHVTRASAAMGFDPAPTDSTRTLWEHFHRRGAGYWTADNRPVSPVLVFDQFEEVFTLGHETPERAARTEQFLDELADLIEGRPPADVKARVDAGEEEASAFGASRHVYKVVFSLRADFLAQLETLRPRIPSVASNRMELGPLRGDAALRVTAAGSALLSERLQERIVRVVADATGGSVELPLHDLIVDPAILSLFCREVNERRKALGQPQITPDLVEGNRDAILGDFYARCVDDLDPAVRRFIEDRLLTVDGYRNSEALQNMLAVPGVTRGVVERLVARRLIRVEQPEGRPPRVELTHDVLAGMVRKSRDAREAADDLARARAESAQAQESLVRAREGARRSRRTAALGGGLALVAVAACGVAVWMYLKSQLETTRAERATGTVEFEEAAHLVQDNEGAGALEKALPALQQRNDASTRSLVLSLLGAQRWPLLQINADGIYYAAYSADGDRIVTASSADNAARIWRTATGAPLREMQHAGAVRSATFSPDGRLLVTASEDSTAQVWDAQTGVKRGAALRHRGIVLFAAFDPTGERVVTASADSTAQVWDVTKGANIGRSVLQHRGVVFSAVFSPDGRYVVTASADSTAQIWNARTGQPVVNPLRHGSIVYAATYSPDGQRVVTAAGGGTAQLWDARTGTTLRPTMRHGGAVLWAAFSADGRRIVTASADSLAQVWDALTGARRGAPLRAPGMVYSAVFSPDGRQILIAGPTIRPSEWAADGRPALPPPPALYQLPPVNFAALSPDGRLVATAAGDSAVRLWDVHVFERSSVRLRHGDRVRWAVYSADGKYVATASSSGIAQVWDALAGTLVGVPMRDASGEINTVAFSPDGRLVVTASEDSTAQIWEWSTGRKIGVSLRHPKNVTSAVFSPDGAHVLTGSADNTAQVWDWRTGARVGAVLRHSNVVEDVAFSPDGQKVATASDDSTAQVWNWQTGAKLAPAMRHHGVVASVAFSPDGRRVLAASVDGTAQIWDAGSGARAEPEIRNQAILITARYSPDGQRVVTASVDHTVQIWDAGTGAKLGPPMVHTAGINCATFSPDGRHVLTASADSTAMVWDPAIFQSALRHVMRQAGAVWRVGFSRDGKWLVSVSADSVAQVWNVSTGVKRAPAMRHGALIASAALSPDGTKVVTASRDGTAQLWDASTGAKIGAPLRYSSIVNAATFDGSGRRLVIGTAGGDTQVWELGPPAKLLTSLPRQGAILSVAFSPDGLRVATASADWSARIWDAATGAPTSERMKHDRAVLSAAFSPDGERVVTSSADSTFQLWDVSGVKLRRPIRLRGWVWSADFNTTGDRIITSSTDGAVRMWDVPALTGRDAPAIVDLAEGVTQSRFDQLGMWQLDTSGASAKRLARIREGLARDANSRPDAFTEFARRLLAANIGATDTSRVRSAP